MMSVFYPATVRQYDTTTVLVLSTMSVFSPATLRNYLILRMYVYYKVFVSSSDTATVRLHGSPLSFMNHMHIMSMFSPAALRHYDTITVPYPKYWYAYNVCVFSSDTATLRHYLILHMYVYCKISVFSCDTATVQHYASPLS